MLITSFFFPSVVISFSSLLVVLSEDILLADKASVSSALVCSGSVGFESVVVALVSVDDLVSVAASWSVKRTSVSSGSVDAVPVVDAVSVDFVLVDASVVAIWSVNRTSVSSGSVAAGSVVAESVVAESVVVGSVDARSVVAGSVVGSSVVVSS